MFFTALYKYSSNFTDGLMDKRREDLLIWFLLTILLFFSPKLSWTNLPSKILLPIFFKLVQGGNDPLISMILKTISYFLFRDILLGPRIQNFENLQKVSYENCKKCIMLGDFPKKFKNPALNFRAVGGKAQLHRTFFRQFWKFAKFFLRTLQKNHYFRRFFKRIKNLALNLHAFARKAQSFGIFWETFQNCPWKFNR